MMPPLSERLYFAGRCTALHLLISLAVALMSAAAVFSLWYPPPYRALLQVGHIYLLILGVDVVCGPLLTLVLASPRKSQRERRLDFSLVGIIQVIALVYGMYTVWVARPVALAFEVDRLVIVTANEVQMSALPAAPEGMQRLPWYGVEAVAIRTPANSEELIRSVERGLAGISLAMQPDWWMPWTNARKGMEEKAKPLSALIHERAKDASALRAAAHATGYPIETLKYLPLVSSKTMDWIALLDQDLNIVGYAEVDGF
ncbi:fimb protein [Pulveribacter suum]|uniref:Fimb protein n=1 Tax=Pulveribacter suum TaxID=2116657 RepID=A0A2P1NI63_9BURK|nr:fimb protein [Pulveribacter suum]AVP56739.1 fimb protein [Pulveribacter suum]